MKRKNPYSQIDVNEISIEVLSRSRVGQRATVGVDVSKGELTLCLVWADREFERPWRVKSPGQIRLAVSKLLELNARCPVTVAMESSGTYGDALRQALDDAGIAVHRVSAKAVKDYSETFDNVPSSHDGKDAAIIGTLCVHGRSVVWRWEGVAEVQNDECGMQNEEGSEVPADRETAAAEPADQFSERDPAIRCFVRQLDTAQRIKQVWCGKLEAMLARHWPEAGRLTNQSGPTLTAAVGLTTACVLWMCLGDPQQYKSAGAYRKAMGLNLTERSSGLHFGKLKLSKRGQRLTRKWLYFSALRWMRHPPVKIWLDGKKKRDGGHGGKAATGIMRRLAAAWHAGQGEVFDPKRLFPGSRAVAASC